jgi:hypothetical protein
MLHAMRLLQPQLGAFMRRGGRPGTILSPTSAGFFSAGAYLALRGAVPMCYTRGPRRGRMGPMPAFPVLLIGLPCRTATCPPRPLPSFPAIAS